MSIDIATAYLNQAQALIAKALGELAPLVPPPPLFYTARTDRTILPKPALPMLGSAGFAFTDPAFGSRMLRVTDGAVGSSWRCPSMSAQAAWNADSTRFYVTGEAGIRVYIFDPGTMTAHPLVSVTSQIEPQFSRVDRDVLYVVAGPVTRTIRKFTLSTSLYTDVLDLDTLGIPGLVDPRTYIGGLTTSQTPENLMCFFGGYSQDRHFYVLWQHLDGTGRKILNTQTDPRLRFNLHSAAMDMSGRFVLLFPTNVDLQAPRLASQVYVWDTLTDNITAITSGDPTKDGGVAEHPGGHGCLGYGVWVNQDQGSGGLPYDNAQWQFRSLALPTTSLDIVDSVLRPQETYIADHSTWNNAKAASQQPFISATYRYGAGLDQTVYPWRAWDDEVLAIGIAPKTVWRFCHHRSDLRDEKNPMSWYFWYEPIANVSPDGRWILFTSNWEKTLGLDPLDPGRFRQDVFLVEAK